MAHQPLAAILSALVGMAAEESCNLGVNGLREQRPSAVAQNLGERVRELSWLDQLEDATRIAPWAAGAFTDLLFLPLNRGWRD